MNTASATPARRDSVLRRLSSSRLIMRISGCWPSPAGLMPADANSPPSGAAAASFAAIRSRSDWRRSVVEALVGVDGGVDEDDEGWEASVPSDDGLLAGVPAGEGKSSRRTDWAWPDWGGVGSAEPRDDEAAAGVYDVGAEGELGGPSSAAPLVAAGMLAPGSGWSTLIGTLAPPPSSSHRSSRWRRSDSRCCWSALHRPIEPTTPPEKPEMGKSRLKPYE